MTARRPSSLAVVVPTFRRDEGLTTLLRALESQTLPATSFEVVVVDDCSGEGAVRRLQALVAETSLRVTVMQTATNNGPAAARNLGWRHSDAELLAFVDDDCEPAPGWLEAGLAGLGDDETLGVVQGRTTAPPGVSIWGLRDWYLWRVIDRAGPYFEGCNVFYRRRALEAVAGFDEEIGYGEDTTTGWLVVEAGWRRGFCAKALMTHPVEHRGWRWFVRTGLKERNIVRLGAQHPGFRREAFWRSWAYRREDAAFLGAVLGGLIGFRWRPGLIGMLPYLWLQRPSIRQAGFCRLCIQIPVVDAARLVGQLNGAIRYRLAVI
ncbi:MAG: glycosyltransferase [Actinomycetota bacterium]|nr:glycosyltransferase [Actinomycetota bacterium]